MLAAPASEPVLALGVGLPPTSPAVSTRRRLPRGGSAPPSSTLGRGAPPSATYGRPAVIALCSNPTIAVVLRRRSRSESVASASDTAASAASAHFVPASERATRPMTSAALAGSCAANRAQSEGSAPTPSAPATSGVAVDSLPELLSAKVRCVDSVLSRSSALAAVPVSTTAVGLRFGVICASARTCADCMSVRATDVVTEGDGEEALDRSGDADSGDGDTRLSVACAARGGVAGSGAVDVDVDAVALTWGAAGPRYCCAAAVSATVTEAPAPATSARLVRTSIGVDEDVVVADGRPSDAGKVSPCADRTAEGDAAVAGSEGVSSAAVDAVVEVAAVPLGLSGGSSGPGVARTTAAVAGSGLSTPGVAVLDRARRPSAGAATST